MNYCRHQHSATRPATVTVLARIKEFSQHTIMLLIAMSFYERRRRNLRAKLDTVINSLSANHACLKTLLHIDYSQYFDVVDRTAMTYVTTLGYQMFKFWHSISIADINNLTSHIIIIVRYFFPIGGVSHLSRPLRGVNPDLRWHLLMSLQNSRFLLHIVAMYKQI